MLTRYPSKFKLEPRGSTGFVMHISQYTVYNHSHNLIDYTEKKLIQYAATVIDHQQRLVIIELIKDYVSGLIAVAWKRGAPIYVRVTKNA